MPTGKARYDNLKAAVAGVLGFSRARVETKRWTAFRSHWGIEMLTDPRPCAAIVDRLTFGGNIIETGSDSHRLAQARAQARRRAG